MTGATTLAEDPRFQYELGVMESRSRAAEALVRDVFEQATAFLTNEGCKIVEQAYNNAGTAALRDGPLQRCSCDIHAGTQHAMVSPAHTYEFAYTLLASAPDEAPDDD